MSKKKTTANQDALAELQANGCVILTADTHEQVMEDAAALIEAYGGNAFVSLAARKDNGEHYAKVIIKKIEEV